MLGSGGTWINGTAFATNSFTIIQPDSGTSPTADSSTDTLTLTSANAHLTIAGNSGTDTITYTVVSDSANTASKLVVRDASGNFAAGTITSNITVIGAGSVGSPSLYFSGDTNTGIYAVGADQFALTAGGYAGLECRKSTGNYANIGMGAAASVSDQYLLLMQRTYSGPIHQQIANPSTDSGAGCKDQLSTDNGNNIFECGLFTAATVAPDAYAGGMATLRSSGSTAGISIVADDVAAAPIKMYCGGNGTANKMMQVDAVDGVSIYRTITAGGTTGAQTINKIAGTVNVAANANTISVVNSMVDANSIVHCVIRTNDATARLANVVPGAGSFTVNFTASATAETSVGFLVVN